MATTTPFYAWPVPTSTDYVKDGASAIESLGDAIDATLSGFLNVKQVISASTVTSTSSSVNTLADTTLTATITPSSTSSKILVIVNQADVAKSSVNAANAVTLTLLRGATSLVQFATSLLYSNTNVELRGATGTVWLDSPNTTAATTYKTQFSNNINGGSVSVQTGGARSTILLVELEF
jgi:hypothetical protein